MENLDDNVEKMETGISSEAKTNLNQGSGWVKAVAILGFVAGGFILLASIGMFLVFPVGGILYLIMAGVYGYLSYLLLMKGQAASQSKFDLDKFAENFHKFWKTTVILMIVLFVLSLIFGFVAGGMMGSGMRF
tara:strand:- start:6798 stop:7196 length:399 start_codon:yes stop_codon:yes gene_type:complete